MSPALLAVSLVVIGSERENSGEVSSAFNSFFSIGRRPPRVAPPAWLSQSIAAGPPCGRGRNSLPAGGVGLV